MSVAIDSGTVTMADSPVADEVRVWTGFMLSRGPLSRVMVQPFSQPENLSSKGSPATTLNSELRNWGLARARVAEARMTTAEVVFILTIQLNVERNVERERWEKRGLVGWKMRLGLNARKGEEDE